MIFTEEDVQRYESVFFSETKKNLNLYYRANKIMLASQVINLDLWEPKQRIFGRVPIVQMADYKELEQMPSTQREEKIEEAITQFAKEAAITVESLIKITATKCNGSSHNVTNLLVTDIFEKSDGNKNLRFNVVLNSPISVADPESKYCGWISYKFLFASGYALTGTK